MLAGFANFDFTPKKGCMPGDFKPMEAEGARIPLFANAAAFTSGKDSVIIISMDVLFFKKEGGLEMRSRISEATGVPVDRILIAATHTHTGPSIECDSFSYVYEPETTKLVFGKTVEAGIAAWNNRSEVKLGVGLGYETRFSFNRGYFLKDGRLVTNGGFDRTDFEKRAGKVDYSVNVMRVEDNEGKVKAFIVNYANHPDNYRGSQKDMYSADYPGVLRNELKREFGEDIVVLFFNGTCGDINCIDFFHRTSDYYYAKGKFAPNTIGEGLADTVKKINENIILEGGELYIRSRSAKCTIPRRFRSEKQYQRGLDILRRAEAGEEMSAADLVYAREYTKSIDGIPPTIDVEVAVLQIGPWAIVGLPSEIFTEIGLKIKANSPYVNTLIFELANGNYGYIATDRMQGTGLYEATYSVTSSYVAKGTERALIETSGRMLDDMFAEEETERVKPYLS